MCTFDYAAFSCSSASLSADGKLSLAIKNEKETAFVHKIICTNSKSPTPPSFGTAFSAEPTIKSGESYSPENGIACLDQNGNALGKIPDDFSGKVWVFYNYASDGQDYPPRVSTASIAKIS